MGLGVRFPDYVKEAFGLADDEDPVVYFQYPLQRYVCDFVELERKIIYQVNGDFWHANPLLYEPEKLTKIQQHNLWHDKNRKRFLEAKGFRVVIAWESEIYWNTELVKNKIRAVRKAANPSRLHRENAGFDSQTAHYDWSQQLRELWFKKPRDRKTKDLTCRYCGVKFTVSARNKREIERKFCGKNCAIKHKTRNKPTAEKLKDLMKSNSWTALGRLYGVSDNAVRKWAKGYDLL